MRARPFRWEPSRHSIAAGVGLLVGLMLALALAALGMLAIIGRLL